MSTATIRFPVMVSMGTSEKMVAQTARVIVHVRDEDTHEDAAVKFAEELEDAIERNGRVRANEFAAAVKGRVIHEYSIDGIRNKAFREVVAALRGAANGFELDNSTVHFCADIVERMVKT